MLLLGFFLLLPCPSYGDPLDNWHWRNPMPPGDPTAVTYSGKEFVIVGQFGTIITSKDGVEWISKSAGVVDHLLGIAYGNGTYASVGDNGRIVTSSDGVMWTSRDSGSTESIRGITYARGKFVAVGDGGRATTSSDGVTWEKGSIGNSKRLNGITFGNEVFVAVGYQYNSREIGYGTIFTSSDGVKWESQTSGTNHPLMGITYGDGMFLAVGGSGVILTSSDGLNWTTRDSKTDRTFVSVAYGNGIFVAAGWDVLCASSDGITWETFPTASYYLYAVAYGSGIFVATGSGAIILTSPNGKDWKGDWHTGIESFLTKVVFGNETFVALGGWGEFFVSPDGINWAAGGSGGDGLSGLAYGNGVYVAVGLNRILSSPDGRQWTLIGVTSADHLKSVTYAAGLFVVVGGRSEGGHAAVLTSTDGVTWVEKTLTIPEWLDDVTYGKGIFVATGGVVATSPDGVNWTERGFLGTSNVTYGNGTFVAVGDHIWTSTDGINWTRRGSAGPLCFYDIHFAYDLFVITGDVCGGDPGMILTSPDGKKWTLRFPGGHCHPRGVGSGHDTLVAVGDYGLILQSDRVAGPKIVLEPTSIEFGDVLIKNFSERTVNIRNAGTEPLDIGTLDISSAPFSVTSDACSGATLTPGESCLVSFGFASSSIGRFSQSLNISSNDLDRPNVEVNLTGTCVAPDLTGKWMFMSQLCTSKCKVKGTLNLQNIGNLDAPSASVRFYLSDNGVDYREDGFLKQISSGTIKAGGGKVKNLSYSFPSGKSASGKYIIAVIDAYNTVMEADETNNEAVYARLP